MKIESCVGERGRKLTTWRFSNVVMTGKTRAYPDVLLSTEGRLVSPYNEMTMSTGITSAYPSGEYIPAIPSPLVPYPGEVFFFVYNTSNYFHFLYDSLPYLLEYLRVKKPVKLLMSEPPRYPFVYESLRLLGIRQSDITYIVPHHVYDTVIVTNSMTHDGEPNAPPRSDIWEVYARMKEVAFRIPIETPKKFYVSRRSWIHGDTSNIGTNYTTRRRMMVEDELVEKLKERGYQEVFCEKLTMAEKVQYFANATHIVGAIGGGMCNLVFSRPDCVTVSINSPEFDTINRRFLHTMTHTQLTQFRETQVTNQLYRRVRIGNVIGEIVEQQGDMLSVNIGNGVTWNESDIPNLQTVHYNDVVYLDNGLNSPWTFDTNKCMQLIQ